MLTYLYIIKSIKCIYIRCFLLPEDPDPRQALPSFLLHPLSPLLVRRPTRIGASGPPLQDLLRKSAPGFATWCDKVPLPVLDGGHRSGGRASVVPNPVRWHRPRRAVLARHELIAGGVRRGTSRGRQSAPRAPQESGATIPGTRRRPGQTDTRARGSDLLIRGPGGLRGVRAICLQKRGLRDPCLNGLDSVVGNGNDTFLDWQNHLALTRRKVPFPKHYYR